MSASLKSTFTESEKVITIQGSVVFNSVTQLLKEWDQLVADLKPNESQSSITLDCSSMDHIDSAGIALFLDWKRQCASKNHSLVLKEIPEQACSLFEAYSLQSFLK